MNSENDGTFEAGFLTEANLQNLRVLTTYFSRNLKLIQGIESKHCKSNDFPIDTYGISRVKQTSLNISCTIEIRI